MEANLNISNTFKQLANVQLEYSSTIQSYNKIYDTFEQLKRCLNNQLLTKNQQLNHFTTLQGRKLRQIMLIHYQELLNKINEEWTILKSISSQISTTHQRMSNYLSLTEPIINEFKDKQNIYPNKMRIIEQNIAQLTKKRLQIQKDHYKQVISQKYCYVKIQQQSYQSKQFSLQTQKIDQLIQIQQLQTLLQIKLNGLIKLASFEKQTDDKSIIKIHQILDQFFENKTEQLQKSILSKINSSIKMQSIREQTSLLTQERIRSINRVSKQIFYDQMKCSESLDQVLKPSTTKNDRHTKRDNIESIKRNDIKKRLYLKDLRLQDPILQEQTQYVESQSGQISQIKSSPNFNQLTQKDSFQIYRTSMFQFQLPLQNSILQESILQNEKKTINKNLFKCGKIKQNDENFNCMNFW